MDKGNFLIIGSSLLVGLLLGVFIAPMGIMPMGEHSPAHGDMEHMREDFVSLKGDIQGNMLGLGMYKCCLEKPCTYCIEKDPKHGAGAACTCLEDIMNGVHPCGECIGEIMEGHGNKFLSPYFATAIAEEMGMQHLDHLKQMMSEKYDISLEEQV